MWSMQRRSAEAIWAAQLIRQARSRLGFDHRWAAGLLGVTPAYLLMVETGMTDPSVSFCRRVAVTFNMPEDEAAELLEAAGAVQKQEARSWQSV